ncbi:MAG: hypothetical protein AB8U25_02100 [Rickettsiales endosymbiont of Dermacentor nuttalli]
MLEKLAKSSMPELTDTGDTKIHLMTYDFFGTPWSKELVHHTNLYIMMIPMVIQSTVLYNTLKN